MASANQVALLKHRMTAAGIATKDMRKYAATTALNMLLLRKQRYPTLNAALGSLDNGEVNRVLVTLPVDKGVLFKKDPHSKNGNGSWGEAGGNPIDNDDDSPY